MKEIGKVAVGSKNPVKIAAVRAVVPQFFEDVEVVSFAAPSQVSEMPFGQEEAITGAENRASYCLQESDADLVFGLEGFVLDLRQKLFLSGWTVANKRGGKMGYGNIGLIELPTRIANRVRAGEELGPVMNDVLGEENIAKKVGAVGVLTDDQVTRQQAFERSVIFSLSPFLDVEI